MFCYNLVESHTHLSPSLFSSSKLTFRVNCCDCPAYFKQHVWKYWLKFSQTPSEGSGCKGSEKSSKPWQTGTWPFPVNMVIKDNFENLLVKLQELEPCYLLYPILSGPLSSMVKELLSIKKLSTRNVATYIWPCIKKNNWSSHEFFRNRNKLFDIIWYQPKSIKTTSFWKRKHQIYNVSQVVQTF